MRRFFCALLCAAALLALSACGARRAPELSETVSAAETTPEAAPETAKEAAAETAEPTAAAVLSPGAAQSSALSAPFQVDDGGAIFTGAATGDGVVYLNDRLPEGTGYISRLLLTEDGVYAAVKEYYFSLDPSSLVRFPPEGGDGEALTDDLSADGRFVLAGDALFYQGYADGILYRLDLTSGETTEAASDGTALLAAADGFLYYAKTDGVYRNDSTMTAETKLFDGNGIAELFAEDGRLAALIRGTDGSSVLEFRAADDGALLAQAELSEAADNILCRNGRVYVPQTGSRLAAVFDLLTGEALDPLPLTLCESYCILQCVTDDALYYETYLDDVFSLCRVPLDGGEAEVVGEIVMF